MRPPMKKRSFKFEVLSLKLRKIFHSNFRMENTPNQKLKTQNLKLNEKGVTLIEVMMVIGIIGFVMSLIATLSFVGMRAWQKQNARVKLESQAQNFIYILSYDLRQAQAGTVAISNYPG